MSIGDYVRTKYGIAKIIDLKENPYGEKTIYILNKSIINIYDCEGSEFACCNPFVEDMQDRFDTKFGDEKCIIKSSPNIIDLIEVGDFIKYNPVQNHYAKKITLYKAIKDEKDLFFLKYQVQNDKLKILSIVTKEQFESMEYKVGD